MNMKFYAGVFFCMLLMLFSCTSKMDEGTQVFDWSDFPAPVVLNGDSLAFDEIMMKPVRVAVVDSFLLLKNSDVERFFHVYNIKTKKKVGERISFGIGPKEMLDPMWFIMSEDTLGILDKNKRIMDIYPDHRLLISDTVSPIHRVSFKELLVNPVYLPEVGIISSTFQSDEHKFALFDFEGNRHSYFGDYPDAYKNSTVYEKGIAFMGDIAVKPDGSRWAMSHKAMDMIEIYDSKLNLINRIQGPDGIFPKVKEGNGHVRREGVSREGYFFPVVTDEYIYVLYDGRVYDLENPTRYLRDKLLVFDWNGKPVKYYQLSEGIFHFDIDKENGVLYGITDYPEFHIVSFPLVGF